jgi:beta-lactam-binding protein with PASTA domain
MRTTTAMSGLLAAGALLLTLGSGVAWATKPLPHVDGMTWSRAQDVLEAHGFHPSVASTLGSHRKRSDCIVVGEREAAQMTGSMDDVTVSLNCQ